MSDSASGKGSVPDHWKWFTEARFGMFIHWGPYSAYGRGEQVLFREHMDHEEYARTACAWNPERFDARLWARTAKEAGMKYACLTTRHHDGYCLWDSRYTDYTSVRQAPGRDFVKEFADAFRAEGLRVGLYYSWLDWRIPAFFDGPDKDPEGWKTMKEYMHNQVIELLTGYGRIDHFFFDGSWPRNADELGSSELVAKMRQLQPHILINNRLGANANPNKISADGGMGAGESDELGDFGTPEHVIVPDPNRLWESNQVTTWRLWGYSVGERWRPADYLLDMLCECAEKGGNKGGNLLLNVGPQPDGQLPPEYVERALAIGKWLDVHGEAIYGSDGGNVTEFVTRGRQTTKGNNLYLIVRFWDGRPEMRLPDLVTPVKRVTLLTTGQELDFVQRGEELVIKGLPLERPTKLFPVIRIECEHKPTANQWGRERLWGGDPGRVADWARTRGTSPYRDGMSR
ncbi:alpha-L-fucosidase [Cohnella sp. CIP 111063]|jgi:Alpha-L-fucosidase|uniref:alpha-L-fucosidase n=1 Tax=unclassified Cohnella TaxID=2636738 RepID=UPI000B8BF314|nr:MULTISPECIES: alpha-L-fucosidase [unclassified Cohnella]OXS59221.1 alpha-L-fucosidase [Cohnella sp. CIP 111063]PRX72234.1 alpha-L-fucosidase [Cohnella sp. SGD-V74]